MDAVHFTATGARKAEVVLEQFPDALYEDLRKEIDALTHEVFAIVQSRTPSKTGRLRSEERVWIWADREKITGRINIDAPKGSEEFAKAGALEYGAHNARGLIKAHSMRLDHAWEQRLDSPITVMVAAHARPPNIAEVSFIRGALAEVPVAERLNAVVEHRAAGANG